MGPVGTQTLTQDENVISLSLISVKNPVHMNSGDNYVDWAGHETILVDYTPGCALIFYTENFNLLHKFSVYKHNVCKRLKQSLIRIST